MKRRIRKFLPFTFVAALVAISAYGIVTAVIFWAGDWNTQARDALAIPLCLLPTAAFLAWLLVGYGKTLDKVQNLVAGCWMLPLSGLTAYAITWVSVEFVKATLAIAAIHALVWLLLAQITRKMYRNKRQANIAKASGRSQDDPDVCSLANNNLLANATVLAMVTTSQGIVMMETYAAAYFSIGAIRAMALIIGCTIGLVFFNLHPTQSDIRKITNQPEQPKGCI